MSDDNREAVVRVVLEAMAPSVAPECICGHPQLAHEDDVGFCWDCDACAADPACREFVERFAGERSDGDSHWATVVIDDAFEPRELTEAESVLLYESGIGIDVERMWIRPGVRDTERPDEPTWRDAIAWLRRSYTVDGADATWFYYAGKIADALSLQLVRDSEQEGD